LAGSHQIACGIINLLWTLWCSVCDELETLEADKKNWALAFYYANSFIRTMIVSVNSVV
jgi:hypothetical protein